MSVATISYNSLKDSAGEAKAVAKKLDTYVEHLNNSIYKKLTSYGGTHTGNIQTAKTSTKAKISELEEKSSAYTIYAQDLIDLKEQCVETDKTVKSRVSQLTATFKKAYGIKNNPVVNAINYCLTSLKNSSFIGRWLNNTTKKIDSFKEYIRQQIRVWWNYEGGGTLVKNIIVTTLSVIASVCLAVAAVLSGGWIVAVIATVVLAMIAVGNGYNDIKNEIRAYDETHNNGDPALGRRRSDESTVQDYLRRETDSKFWHNVANVIDVTSFVCTAITIVDSVGNLLKNGFKWATNSTVKLKDLKVKDILSRNGLRRFFSGFKGKMGEVKMGFENIGQAIKMKNLTFFKDGAIKIKTDFLESLKKRYWDMESPDKAFKSYANTASTLKSVVSDGVDFDDILKNIVLPNIMVFSGVDLETGKTTGKASFYDFYKIFDKSKSLKKDVRKNSFVSDDSKINQDVLEKLTEKIEVNIVVPEIYVPEIYVRGIDTSNVKFA